jgi:uncharacterized tellurite resistance protein B-like protein
MCNLERMNRQDFAILTSLVSVAWVDGRVDKAEQHVLDALLAAFDATPSEALQIREYARTPRTLDDIPLSELNADDRRSLLQQATQLILVDGEFHDKEQKLIDDLCERLQIGQEEAVEIVTFATRRAQELTRLL